MSLLLVQIVFTTQNSNWNFLYCLPFYLACRVFVDVFVFINLKQMGHVFEATALFSRGCYFSLATDQYCLSHVSLSLPHMRTISLLHTGAKKWLLKPYLKLIYSHSCWVWKNNCSWSFYCSECARHVNVIITISGWKRVIYWSVFNWVGVWTKLYFYNREFIWSNFLSGLPIVSW